MLVFGLISTFLFAQNSVDSQLLLQLEKGIFLSNDIVEIDSLLLVKADYFKQRGDFDQVSKVLDRSPGSSAYLDRVRYERSLAYFQTKQYRQSLNQANLVRFMGKDSVLMAYTSYLLVSNHLMLGEFEKAWKAMEFWKKWSAPGADLDRLRSDLPPPELKSLKKAENLSLFLPGTGQIYAGSWGKGILSGFLVAGSAGFTVWQFLGGYYGTTVLGAGLLYAFYSGGIRYALELTERNNQREIKRYAQKVVEILERRP